MRVVLFGCQEIAVRCLSVLLSKRASVLLVFTSGTEKGLNKRENIKCYQNLRKVAGKYRIPVVTLDNVNSAMMVKLLGEMDPDVILSVFWNQLFSRDILNIPKHGCINLHASLLPKYRGASPLFHVLLNGETQTGVTLHYIDEKVDHGDIIAQIELPIDVDDNIDTLRKKAMEVGATLFEENIVDILKKKVTRIPQNHDLATYYPRITNDDRVIDWSRPAVEISRKVKAFAAPHKACFAFMGKQRIYITKASILDSQFAEPGHIYAVIREKGVVVGTGYGRLLLEKVENEYGKHILMGSIGSSVILNVGQTFSK